MSSLQEKPTSKDKTPGGCCFTGSRNTCFKERLRLCCLKNYLNKCGCSMVLFSIFLYVTIIALGGLVYCLLHQDLKDIKHDCCPKSHEESKAVISSQCIKGNTVNISCDKINYPASIHSSNANPQNTLLYLVGFIILIMFFLILIGAVGISSYRKSFMQFYLDDKELTQRKEEEHTKQNNEKTMK